MAVEAIISVVIQKLSDFLNEESEIFKKVGDEEIEKVMKELGEMQSILNSNAEYEEQSNTVLRFLGIVYRVEDTIESFCNQTHLKRMGVVKKRFSVIAKELKRCRDVPETTDYSQKKLDEVLKSKMELFSKEIKQLKDGIPSLAPSSPLQVFHEQSRIQDIISEKEMMKVLKQEILTSDTKPLQIISVFGEIGIENAAHTVTIYKNREIKKKFDCRVLLVVDTNWSVRHLILDIMKQVITSFKSKLVRPEDEDLIETLDGLLEGKEKLKDEVLIGRLHGFLKGKKYLIVINDIKSLHLLEKLRGALPDSYNGSRVVITTPDEGTASFGDATNRYCYKPLDKENGFKKFKDEVQGLVKGSRLSVEIKGCLKQKIADICRGNPLRIKLLAGFLSKMEKTCEDWSSIDKQLDFACQSPSFDITDFCYNDLPRHMKPCFLYLGLFQKGFEIPVRRLFQLWLAEGFVKPIQGKILEDTVKAYLKELVHRNMVEITKKRTDQSPKKCRMIGFLHDIFRPRAVEIGLFHLQHKYKRDSNAAAEHRFGVRRVVECTSIKDYLTSKAFNQNLQSYISLNNRKKDMFADEVGTFLERIIGTRGFGLLKVLNLEGVDRPRLPQNLGNLYFLRYLGLRCTFLNALPSALGALLHLETLDIKHTQIKTVPSSIWNMKHLRHLFLNGAPIDISLKSMEHTFPPQLQTLQGLFVDDKIARKIGSTLSSMTKLQKLDLTREFSSEIIITTSSTTTTRSHSSTNEDTDSLISLPSCLRSLKLRSKNKMGRPSKLNIIKDFSSLENLSQLYLLGHLPNSLDWYKIPSGLKVLTLSVSQLKEDPMPTLSKLSDLIILRLLATSYEGKEMCFPANGFPNLQVLKLWKLENLEILTVNEGAMQKLQTLEIRCCEKLIEEEVPDTLLKIKKLRNLILTNMPKPFVTAMKRRKKKHYEIEVDPYMKSAS